MNAFARWTPALAALAFVACTCGKDSTTARRLGADGGAAAAVSPEKLLPTIRQMGPYQGMPTSVVFEFPRAIAGGADLNHPLAGKTVFLIEPATKGNLTFSGPSTLTFVPADPFQFGQMYRVTLDAVETSEGVITSPKPGLWQYT